MVGKTLGHYQITSQLGKGGMGEVYQAKDGKLGRDVAIKVLPEEFAKDADRVARFQREAKVLASLNHPNIAAIYGLEEAGGTDFLVLELLEGDTLADRIATGPIPVEEALRLALQIAEALEAAHEKGIIHRDLKPANIKVTPDGKVKVLDFGLAKAFAEEQAELNLSNSPTLSDAATQQGIILGTAAYMSPEQAKGKEVDKRADIWAFGCVLFEMLTGQQLFSGETVSETLAAVLMKEPDFSRLPQNLHPRIVEALQRCLERETRNRYGSISDARVDIQQALTNPSGVLAQTKISAERQLKWRSFLWIPVVIVVAIIAGIVAWRLLKPSEPHAVMRFDCDIPEGLQSVAIEPLAIGNDGKQFAYSTSKGIYIRSMDELTPKLIPGTDGNTQNLFFSPDGKFIGYYSTADQKLKKIAASGGVPVTLCETTPFLGANWNEDDTIVYGGLSIGNIMRVSANGGTPEAIVKSRPGMLLAYPQILPGGKAILYMSGSDTSHAKVTVQSLKSGEPKELLEAQFARYLPTGHIVYGFENNPNLYAIRFDLNKLEVTGGSTPVVEGVAIAAISDSGTLIYLPATASTATQRTLVWVDQIGKEEPFAVPHNAYFAPRISPDGSKVAMSVGGGGDLDIWIWDMIQKNLTRLTFGGYNATPVWTPDGKRIVFLSYRDGKVTVLWKSADGAGKDELLLSGPGLTAFPSSWATNGKTLALAAFGPTGFDIGTLSMEGNRKWTPLLNEKYHEAQPQISPDGRWMAYTSNESGQNQIYMRPFPEVNSGRWQISTNGGDSPLWSRDGKGLFYRNGDAVMTASVKTSPTFSLETAKTLFRGAYVRNAFMFGNIDFVNWDISPDGKRFLMLKEVAAEAPRKINVVVNWFEELKQRVPKK